MYSLSYNELHVCAANDYNANEICITASLSVHSRERERLLDLGNGQRRVEALGAGPGAVEDGVAAVDAHAIVQGVLAGGSLLVTRVGDPAVRLHQHGGAEVFLAVPPVRRAGGAAACAENALVHAVQLLAVGRGLETFTTLIDVSNGPSITVNRNVRQLPLPRVEGMA